MIEAYDIIARRDQIMNILSQLESLENDLGYYAWIEDSIADELAHAKEVVRNAINGLTPALLPLHSAQVKLYSKSRQIIE